MDVVVDPLQFDYVVALDLFCLLIRLERHRLKVAVLVKAEAFPTRQAHLASAQTHVDPADDPIHCFSWCDRHCIDIADD